MPNWKKVIVSGSDATLNSIYVANSVTASIFSGSFTGSLEGTSSWALNAITASYALNASGGGLSALYIQDEGVTQGTASYINFTGTGVTATVSNSTASISITGGGGSAIQGASQTFSQSIAATTWSFAHGINSRTPVVEVYDSSYNVILPTNIYNPGPFQTNIYFDVAQSGFAIISTGGVLAVSGSNAILNQTSAATTWSFSHDLHTTYPVFTVYDENNDVIIPQRINVVDTASAVIYFSTPRTGKAVASVGGNIGFASESISSSFATTASYALTASYLENYIPPFPFTGSAGISGSLIVDGDITSTGTITAQSLHVQLITSSIAYVTGSTQFGSLLSNTHQFTGSVSITGSLNVNNSSVILSNQTSSMSVASASFAQTAISSSFSSVAISASYASSSTSASYADNALSSSYALTASYAANVPATSSFAISASQAESASYALTASYSLSGTGFPFSGSAIITGSLLVSQSFVDFTQATYVTGSFTGSLFGTSSYAITASYAVFASNSPGFTVQFSQSVAATTWSFVHNLNTRNPIVQVYDTNYKQIVPNDIVGVNVNTAEVRFDYAQAGYVVMSNGGGLYVTGSTSELLQTSAATTWSFTHNLNSKYINFEVYDLNDYVIIPSGIKVLDTNNAELYFAYPQTGRAVAQFSGINGAPNATTASYALTATSASYSLSGSYVVSASYANNATNANTASFITLAQTASYVQNAQTASYVLNAVSASYSISSSHAAQAISASYALTASFALTASSALNASDILVYVKNSTGAQINKGTVVRIAGAVGDNPLISTASYTDDNNSANTLGITNENIANDSFGYVMTEGKLLGIDTSIYSVGQLLYLGANGALTGSAPHAPLHAVRLGQVLRSQLNNGSMYVRIDNGFELGELHDVRDTSTTASFGDLLVRSGSVWTNSRQLTGSYELTGSLNNLGRLRLGDATNTSFTFNNSDIVSITRPANPSDNNFMLSFVRDGNSVSGISYVTGSNRLAIWAGSNATFPSTPTMTWTGATVGIATSNPSTQFGLDSSRSGRFTAFTDHLGLTVTGSLVVTQAITASVFSGSLTGSLQVTGNSTYSGSQTFTTGYIVLTQVSQSLDFINDTAAAAGGVPLGGLYRNGNFIAIRIS